jgi:hypothetical protein
MLCLAGETRRSEVIPMCQVDPRATFYQFVAKPVRSRHERVFVGRLATGDVGWQCDQALAQQSAGVSTDEMWSGISSSVATVELDCLLDGWGRNLALKSDPQLKPQPPHNPQSTLSFDPSLSWRERHCLTCSPSQHLGIRASGEVSEHWNRPGIIEYVGRLAQWQSN